MGVRIQRLETIYKRLFMYDVSFQGVGYVCVYVAKCEGPYKNGSFDKGD